MAKFYVESGEFRVVVQARGPIAAAARALSWVTPEDHLDQVVLVNERGFVRDRMYRTDADVVSLETGTMMSLIHEHELC